jgi:hypothetical protein
LIERFCNRIKQCRVVATRYDQLGANYLAFVKLASIRIWLRANESAPAPMPGMTWKTPRRLFDSAYICHHLPQAIGAQAVPAIARHRQPRDFLGAPARFRQAADEFRAAAGTSQPARWWIS